MVGQATDAMVGPSRRSPVAERGLSRRSFLLAAAATAAGVTLRPRGAAAADAPSEPWFDRRFGPWIAGDVPRAYELGGGHTLWITNDSFLSGRGGDSIEDASFVRNAAFTSRAGRLELKHRPDAPYLGSGGDPFDEWWWFHGGCAVDDVLFAFTSRMRRTGPRGWAINFEYHETWLAKISTKTCEILDLQRAADPSTKPLYGFSVASDDRWTYLFGNPAMYGERTTETWLARVPFGELKRTPKYWDGSSWSSDRADAKPVHRGGTYANRLHVVHAGDRWLAVCKHDEFFGSELRFFESSAPSGPWKLVQRRPLATITGDDRTCTYDAQGRVLPDGRFHVWWSNNAFDEADVRRDPSLYRPSSTVLDGLPSFRQPSSL